MLADDLAFSILDARYRRRYSISAVRYPLPAVAGGVAGMRDGWPAVFHDVLACRARPATVNAAVMCSAAIQAAGVLVRGRATVVYGGGRRATADACGRACSSGLHEESGCGSIINCNVRARNSRNASCDLRCLSVSESGVRVATSEQ